jgi:ribonuclease HI
MKVLSPKRNCRIRWVSELLDNQGNWKEEMIRTCFLPIDADLILRIKPSRRFDGDVVACQPEQSGIFSVRSAYKIALNELPEQCLFPTTSSRPDGDDLCWTKIWNSNTPPKVKMFAWKAASNALSTEVNKRTRGMKVTGTCLICGMEQEDSSHALYRCPHAQQLWSAMRECWQLPLDKELRGGSAAWFKSVINSSQPQIIDCLLLVAWRVWYAHNEATHNKPIPPIEVSKRFLISYMKIHTDLKSSTTEDIIKGKATLVVNPTQCMNTSVVRKESDKKWLIPSPGWVKLNCDGSFKEADGTAGGGMILRDDLGQVIFSACSFLRDCDSPLEAETRACLEGLQLALDRSDKPIQLELDCSVLLNAIKVTSLDRSPLTHVISEIKTLANGSRNIIFVKVDRSQNRASHCLANLARAEGRTVLWSNAGSGCLS